MMSRRIFTISTVLLTGAGAVYSISQPCQTALAQVATSPDASCLNVGAIPGILTTPANQSIIQPLDNYLKGACAASPCSNQTLSNIVANITTGCQSDLQAAGLTVNQDNITTTVQQLYPVVREEFCLKQTSNNTFCVTSILTEIQNIDGPISLGNIQNYANILGGPSSIPNNITCSDCVKQMYNIVNRSGIAEGTNLTSSLQQTCGSDFVNGQTPSGIINGTGAAATSTSTSTSASTSASSEHLSFNALYGAMASLLVTVSSIFVLLA